MPETDPVVGGDLPEGFTDSVRKKLPPTYASPGSTLSHSEQRKRRWKHRWEYLKQEIAGHAFAFFLIISVVGFFLIRRGIYFVALHFHHHN
jgi:hypothetical protein